MTIFPPQNLKKLFVLIFLVLILIPLVSFLLRGKQIILFKEPKTFILAESYPQDYDNNISTIAQPTFVFSQKLGIAENDLDNYISIIPRPLGNWHMEKNGQVIYFSSEKKQTDAFPDIFAYDTVYTIGIKKTLIASNGKFFPNNITIRFKTRKNPLFALRAEKKLIATLVGQPVNAVLVNHYRYDNSDPAPPPSLFTKAVIYTVSEKQLLEYLSYKKDKEPFYTITLDNGNRKITEFPLTQWVKDASGKDNVVFDLPKFEAPGLYYVRVEDEKAMDDFFVIVSQHITNVFHDNTTMYTWTANSNGKSIRNTTVQFYSLRDNPRLIDTKVTNDTGISETKTGIGDIDLAITRTGDDVAITKTASFEEKTQNLLQVFSYADRPIYRPGDTVHYKAVIRKKERGTYTIPQETLYVRLARNYGEAKSEKDYKPIQIDENGTVTYDAQLPKSVLGINPQIVLATKRDSEYTDINFLYLNVLSYRKPDMDITATTTDAEYISKDKASFAIVAKTLYGKPLRDVPFSYRVLIDSYGEIRDRELEHIDEKVSGYYGYGKEFAAGQGVFDEKGKATIIFSTDLAGFEESQIVTLEVTPQIGASPSIGKIAKLIHRGTFAFFFEDVEGNIEDGIKGKVLSLNHNKPRRQRENQSSTISLYRVVGYQNKSLLDQQAVITASDAATTAFTFPNITEEGTYEVVVQGKDERDNIVTSRYPLFVDKKLPTMPQQAPYQTITLKPQKETYKPGEQAIITAVANFSLPDIVIATTTSKGSYSYFGSEGEIISVTTRPLNNNTITIPVDIPKNQVQPVGVTLFTVFEGKVFKQNTHVVIDKKGKKLTTTVSFDKKEVAPGDTIKADIITKDASGKPVSADTSLAVIDGSILQIGQLNEDIFDAFYASSIAPSITTFDSTTGIFANPGGGGGGGCFLAGTKIRMAEVLEKNIEDVRIGDTILTRTSDRSNLLVEDTVTKIFRHVVNDYLTINNTLHITPVHRIFVNNEWKEAKQIRIGDNLLDEYGNFITVTSIEQQRGLFVVYNLETKTQHTFFANGFYVHNEKGLEPRQNFVDTAYWNPHIKTDQQGKATVTIKVPDNLTTFTAQVFANTTTSYFGQTTEEFIATKAFTIIPTIPNFYYQNDKPVISALVQNTSGNDVAITFTLSVKELNVKQTKELGIKSGDFEEIEFPIDLATQKDNLSFLFEAKDRTSGKILDAVLLKKPVLPRGSIVASWMSFEGSKDVTFSPQYPALDFNTIDISLVAHPANLLLQTKSFSFDRDPSSRTGIQLYVWAYILAKTKDGQLSPTIYNYARLHAEFREAIQELLASKQETPYGIAWYPKYPQQGDSYYLTTLSLISALKEANSYGLVKEITNAPSIIDQALRSIGSSFLPFEQNSSSYSPTPLSLTDMERMMAVWVLHENATDTAPEFFAARVLNGDSGALTKLYEQKIPSANDRHIWDGTSVWARTLPVLAVVEKGTKQDADKAIKGLSTLTAVYYGNYYGDIQNSLALLAGVKHAIKNNMPLQKQQVIVSANKETIYESDDKDGSSNGFSHSLTTKNTSDGKIIVNIVSTGKLPIYTTIAETAYQATSENPQFFRLFTNASSQGKVVDDALTRTYSDLRGKTIDTVASGQSGIVVLSADVAVLENKFKSGRDASLYSLSMIDAISPAFMILNQISGNSPQYQSVLRKLFPGLSEYDTTYFSPTEFSDQVAFFDGSPPRTNTAILLPYVVYGISEGSYYQPKTSVIFPYLGLILKEK